MDAALAAATALLEDTDAQILVAEAALAATEANL